MRSRLAIVPDHCVFDGDRSGVTADRGGVQAVDRFDSVPNIGREAYRLSTHESTVAKGSVVVGLLWLALYVIAIVYSPVSEPASTPKSTASMTTPSVR
jgi:hypothetical protein